MRALSVQYPNTDATLAAIANLRAALSCRKRAKQDRDIHGEFKKLIHVIKNASGCLRPLVEHTFGKRATAGEKLDLLNIIYYPRETYEHVQDRLPDSAARRQFLGRRQPQIELLRQLAPLQHGGYRTCFPPYYETLFLEPLRCLTERSEDYVDSMLDQFVEHGQELTALRLMARIIRNSFFSELIVAGDLARLRSTHRQSNRLRHAPAQRRDHLGKS